MQNRRCDVNPICSKHEVHRWHLRATVTVGLLQQQQFLQPEQHDYPGHLTSTAFWNHSSCNRMTHAELSAFGSLWYRTALRATFANKKEIPHVNAFRDACAIKIFFCDSAFQCIDGNICGAPIIAVFVALIVALKLYSLSLYHSCLFIACVTTYLFFIASPVSVDMKSNMLIRIVLQ